MEKRPLEGQTKESTSAACELDHLNDQTVSWEEILKTQKLFCSIAQDLLDQLTNTRIAIEQILILVEK